MYRQACAVACSAALLVAAATSGPLAVVQYHTDDLLIVVPVAVNGTPLTFYLDTGAQHSVIDAAAAQKLHLQVRAEDRLAGAGRGTVVRKHAGPVTLAIGKASMRVRDPWILDLSHIGTTRHIDGLIGVDFMHSYVIRVDPVAGTLEVFARGREPVGGGTAIRMENRNDKLFVRMQLRLPNRKPVAREVRIDTGSDDAVSDNMVRDSSVRRKSVEGVGLGQSYVDYSGLFASVALGPYIVHDAWGPSNDTPAVGMEILRRFTFTIDVPDGYLRIVPNSYLSDPVPTPAS